MIKFLGKIGLIIYFGITKNYNFEAQFFGLVRELKDGITFFEFKVNLDRYKGNHSPAFQLELTVFNVYNHIWIYRNEIEHD